MIKKTNSHALMEQGVCAAIGFVKRFMSANSKSYEDIFESLEQDDKGHVSCEALRDAFSALIEEYNTEEGKAAGETFGEQLAKLKADCVNVIEHYLDRTVQGSFLPSKLMTVSKVAEQREKYDMLLVKKDRQNCRGKSMEKGGSRNIGVTIQRHALRGPTEMRCIW